jgi:hypothetical protein
MLCFMQVEGREVADVELPDRIQLVGDATPLVLNGAGIRKKFFFSIYLASLYLPALSDDAEAILDADQPRRIQMDMLHSKVEKEKLVDAWNEGFAVNHSEKALAPLKERISRFNELFETLVAGDQVQLDYLPAIGTRVVINGKERGVIAGEDFNQALLKIWLGESPVTDSLKRDLLGG